MSSEPATLWEVRGAEEGDGGCYGGFLHGCKEGGILRAKLLGTFPDGPANGAACTANPPCRLPGKDLGSFMKAPGEPYPGTSTAPWWFPVQPSPAGAF